MVSENVSFAKVIFKKTTFFITEIKCFLIFETNYLKDTDATGNTNICFSPFKHVILICRELCIDHLTDY